MYDRLEQKLPGRGYKLGGKILKRWRYIQRDEKRNGASAMKIFKKVLRTTDRTVNVKFSFFTDRADVTNAKENRKPAFVRKTNRLNIAFLMLARFTPMV